MTNRPQPNEYGEFFAGYVQLVPQNTDIEQVLREQAAELHDLIFTVFKLNDARANQRPEPREWSLNEIIGHISDTERVFAYRTLAVLRGDLTVSLPGFDQDQYVDAARFNARTLESLVTEFSTQRAANIYTFSGLNETELSRTGIANGAAWSVRAGLYIMAGHVIHHIESLKALHGA